jgi:hypothetical protein
MNIDVVTLSDQESLSDLSGDGSESTATPTGDEQQLQQEENETEESEQDRQEQEQQELQALRADLLQHLGVPVDEVEVEEDVPIDFFGSAIRNWRWEQASTDQVLKKKYLDRLDGHPTKIPILAEDKKDWRVPLIDQVYPVFYYWTQPVYAAQRNASGSKRRVILHHTVHHTILRVTFLRESHYHFKDTRSRQPGAQRVQPPRIQYYAYSKVYSKLCQVKSYQAYRVSVHLRRPKPKTTYIKHHSRKLEQDQPVRYEHSCAGPTNERSLPVQHKLRLKKLRALSLFHNNPELTFHAITNETEDVVFAYEAAYGKNAWIDIRSTRTPAPKPVGPPRFWRFNES